MPKKYTDQELLELLREFERKEGKPPRAEDFRNNTNYPDPRTYRRHFEFWNRALEIAGLSTIKGGVRQYTDEELLELLKTFEEEYGRPPTQKDFNSNPKYPNVMTYTNRFGSWQKALKLIGLDVDSIVRKGIVETYYQKARLSEIYVLKHFTKKDAKDLSGKNPSSPFDGICPNNQTYDVKSSALMIDHWGFKLSNLYRGEIEWFYLLGFNEDYSELQHVWRIPGYFTDENSITIGINSNYTHNIENMKEHEITEKFKDISIF